MSSSTLSQMATRFRTRVGESLATIEKYSTPLEEATTPSLEALKAYSAGMKAVAVIRPGAGPAAVPACGRDRSRLCDRPCAGSGSATAVMGESALARQSMLKAYQLRNRASDAERFFIETLYDRDVTGNLERERRDAGNVGADLSARSHAARIAGRSRHDEHRQIRAGDRRSREGHRAGSRPELRAYTPARHSTSST